MRRIYELPTGDQLSVMRTLSDRLSAEFGEESEVQSQAKKRADSLDAMARVAERLGLPDGVAPTATQYRSVWKQVAPDWSATRVHDAWGRYEFCKRAFRGEWVPESSAQRAVRRSSGGRARTHEDYLDGVRLWLKEAPGSLRMEDYADFVRSHNLAGAKRPTRRTSARRRRHPRQGAQSFMDGSVGRGSS